MNGARIVQWYNMNVTFLTIWSIVYSPVPPSQSCPNALLEEINIMGTSQTVSSTVPLFLLSIQSQCSMGRNGHMGTSQPSYPHYSCPLCPYCPSIPRDSMETFQTLLSTNPKPRLTDPKPMVHCDWQWGTQAVFNMGDTHWDSLPPRYLNFYML